MASAATKVWLVNATDFAGLTKTESYEQLIESLRGLLVHNWVADLSNAASLLWYHFRNQSGAQAHVNWAGFYVADAATPNQLILGPFQGKVACQTIGVGRGVVGHAVATNTSQVVTDVEQFPGHIACDGDTRSEIVVPISVGERVLGVIDIDSTELAAFDEEDTRYLLQVAELLRPSLGVLADHAIVAETGALREEHVQEAQGKFDEM